MAHTRKVSQEQRGAEMSAGRASLPDDTALLITAVAALLRCPCQFYACDGFGSVPQDMVTCARCWALHEVFAARPALQRQLWDDGTEV